MVLERHFVDTNVLVRFFTQDPPEMAAKAKALVGRADAGEIALLVPPLVLAETFFTLESFYKFKRRDIASNLLGFLGSKGIVTSEAEIVVAALHLVTTHNAHFVDAYLAASAAAQGIPISSFDRDFDQFPGVVRKPPG
jgi:predicted nucleic acid-binding protein